MCLHWVCPGGGLAMRICYVTKVTVDHFNSVLLLHDLTFAPTSTNPECNILSILLERFLCEA
jgi:hypothetical protein